MTLTSSLTQISVRSYVRLVMLTVPLAGMIGSGCSSSDSTPSETSGSGGSGGSGGAKAGSGGSGGAKAGSGGSGGANAGSGGSGGMCPSNAGGPIAASTPDAHCTVNGVETKQETNESACKPPDGGLPPDTGDDSDAGTSDFGDTMNGNEGDDDDCKYHLKWTASCVEENQNVTFNVTVTKKIDGTPLTKAPPDLEVFLSPTHSAPDTTQTPKETAPGVYTAGPIRFDASGKWTVRFHLREECVDLTDDSPHGHAAFYVNVP